MLHAIIIIMFSTSKRRCVPNLKGLCGRIGRRQRNKERVNHTGKAKQSLPAPDLGARRVHSGTSVVHGDSLFFPPMLLQFTLCSYIQETVLEKLVSPVLI